MSLGLCGLGCFFGKEQDERRYPYMETPEAWETSGVVGRVGRRSGADHEVE